MVENEMSLNVLRVGFSKHFCCYCFGFYLRQAFSSGLGSWLSRVTTVLKVNSLFNRLVKTFVYIDKPKIGIVLNTANLLLHGRILSSKAVSILIVPAINNKSRGILYTRT